MRGTVVNTRSLRFAPAALLIAALAGCSGKVAAPTSSGSSEQTNVTSSLTHSPDLLDDGLYTDPSSTPASATTSRGNTSSLEAAISPRFFWRTIVSAVPRLTFVFSDTDSVGRPRQADVLVTRRILGTFNILKASSSDSTVLDSANIVHKPIDDIWLRHLRLRRFVLPGEANVWRVVAASGIQASTQNGSTSITSVRVQATGVDTTVTDPLQLFQMVHCFQFAPGDSIVLTATTPRTDDVVLAYWTDHRERFRSNGDGTYSFTIHLNAVLGYRYFAINALSHGTLFDDALPYDSMAWILHCFVGAPPHPYYE
ncbi:MAG TPA: hypothetical protein VMJ70_06795 [Candidatus Sulfotelmatobacter sp.]|nr:hypothetical protein [Candidatus Sulfotelmatobacter sp.]